MITRTSLTTLVFALLASSVAHAGTVVFEDISRSGTVYYRATLDSTDSHSFFAAFQKAPEVPVPPPAPVPVPVPVPEPAPVPVPVPQPVPPPVTPSALGRFMGFVTEDGKIEVYCSERAVEGGLPEQQCTVSLEASARRTTNSTVVYYRRSPVRAEWVGHLIRSSDSQALYDTLIGVEPVIGIAGLTEKRLTTTDGKAQVSCVSDSNPGARPYRCTVIIDVTGI